MTDRDSFAGFFRETPAFFAELAKNNTKLWFDEHRADFQTYVMTPAQLFVQAIGARLQIIAPDIIADPRVNRSLFRLNRDVRFSKDKSPYKTHLAFWFWEGGRPRMENSGFYFHIEPDSIMTGSGLYFFPKPLLAAYRQAVVHPVYGPQLAEAIAAVRSRPGYDVWGKHYKKVPAGFDPGHENSELLLYDGMTAFLEEPIPAELFSAKIVDYVYERFAHMAPIHRWVADMIARI
ncbi:MAG: DUF2461 domain-containing protein [Deltaproteobacteria bacterium]|nr:DUF2461 domain-containing protein [Candidatus Zymogenaceae bacterium]